MDHYEKVQGLQTCHISSIQYFSNYLKRTDYKEIEIESVFLSLDFSKLKQYAGMPYIYIDSQIWKICSRESVYC